MYNHNLSAEQTPISFRRLRLAFLISGGRGVVIVDDIVYICHIVSGRRLRHGEKDIGHFRRCVFPMAA